MLPWSHFFWYKMCDHGHTLLGKKCVTIVTLFLGIKCDHGHTFPPLLFWLEAG